MTDDVAEILSLAGKFGLDLSDVRILMPALNELPDDVVAASLKRGQAVRKLEIHAKLHSIIDAPKSQPKDIISVLQYLRPQDNASGNTLSAGDQLVHMLKKTVPQFPDKNYNGENDDA